MTLCGALIVKDRGGAIKVMAYLVVRMRGTVNVPYWANTTLESLNLAKKFRATIVPESTEYSGMLNRIRQLVTWCRVDNETVKDLLDKKGRKTASQSLKESDLPKEYSNLDKLASDIANDAVVSLQTQRYKTMVCIESTSRWVQEVCQEANNSKWNPWREQIIDRSRQENDVR